MDKSHKKMRCIWYQVTGEGQRNKLGITIRHPRYRLNEYITSDVKSKFYKICVFYFDDIKLLFEIEKMCLRDTVQFGIDLGLYPNNECRYGDAEEIFALCSKHLYGQILTHDEAMALPETRITLADEERKRIRAYRKKFDSYEQLIAYKRFPYNLHGYQIEAYKQLSTILHNEQKAFLHVLCRCGKSILFQKYAHDNFENFDIIIYNTERLVLIGEMIERWQKIFTGCEIYELSSAGRKTCISDDVLASKIQKGIKIILFTCQKSCHRLNEIMKSNLRKLFIFDEAHKLCVRKSPIRDLMEGLYDQDKVIFSTATPKYGNYLISDICYNNNVRIYGSNFIRFLDIAQAIEQKFMTECKLIAVAEQKDIDYMDTVASMISNLISNLMYVSDPSKPGPRKFLMYSNKINQAELFMKFIQERFPQYKSYICHSRRNARDNRNDLQSFISSDEISFMFNVNMLAEGIDIAQLDAVVFLDARNSTQDVTQIICRPRSYVVNKTAYVLVPVALDKTADPKMNTILQIIRCLYEQNDPAIVDFVERRKYAKRIAKSKGSFIDANICIDEDIENIMIDFADYFDKKKKNLTFAIIDLLSDFIPRNIDEITQSTKFTKDECNLECVKLVTEEKIKTNEDLFFIEKPITIKKTTKDEFIRLLQERSITTSEQYHSIIDYDDIFVPNPCEEYKFEWSELVENESDSYKSIDEIKQAIDVVLSNPEAKKEIYKIKSAQGRLDLLHKYDGKISMHKQHNIKKLGDIHQLFRLAIKMKV